jgi:hypothetical protein
MQSGRFGYRRVLHGPASSQWVVHTAEQFPGAPPQATRRPTWRVASLHLLQEDATTATGVLLIWADLPQDALQQLTRELSYMLVGADDALYLECVRATDLGTVELLGEVRRLAMDEAEAAADEDDRRLQEPPPFRTTDLPMM